MADSMEAMLTDTNAAERIAELKKTDKTAWEKLRDLVRKLLDSIRSLYKDLKPNSFEGQRVREMGDALEQLSDLFVEGLSEASGKSGKGEGKISYQIRQQFTQEIDQWARDGKPNGETFILGSTGSVLQGLGAIESDIYMESAKINKIFVDHPEMTLDEIKKIPQILDDPALVLKSKNVGRGDKQNSRLVIFGSYKAKNSSPILSVLDLRPNQNGFVLDDMQQVASAYTKTTSPAKYIMSSDALYLDKKRTASVLRLLGFQMPSNLLRNGYIGSITYAEGKVNIEGVPFSKIVENDEGRYSYQERYQPENYTEAEKKQHVADAKAFFGKTYKWSETGYVTVDGTKLDFSGRHEGGPGDYRTVDHRDIRDALGEDYGGEDYSGAMVQFMAEGNIRISPESGGINLSVMPTNAQMATLSDFISRERGEVIIDIDDTSGNTVSSTEYPRGTHSSRIVNDIKAYFENGTVPQVSELSRFRYQERGLSNREILATALDSAAQNPREREVLAEYKDAIGRVEGYEARLNADRAELKRLSFAPGKQDTQRINELKNEIRKNESRVRTVDRRLLQLESMESMKNLLAREKTAIKKKEAQRRREAVTNVREKEAQRRREAVTNVREKEAQRRREAVTNVREKGHERELRQRIEKHVSALSRKLLTPTDKQHIPEELRLSVAALSLLPCRYTSIFFVVLYNISPQKFVCAGQYVRRML